MKNHAGTTLCLLLAGLLVAGVLWVGAAMAQNEPHAAPTNPFANDKQAIAAGRYNGFSDGWKKWES